jgi:predicted ribosome quality control (RQC) complex YloA/Tae2 family protein
VAVSCTEARHVSKPKGTPAGTVNIQKETVLKVKPLEETVIVQYRQPQHLPPT